MTDAQLQALGDQFVAGLPKRFPSLVLNNEVSNVIVGFVNRCQENQVDFNLEHMYACVETNRENLTWRGTAITDAINAEKEKSAKLMRQRLRENLGLVTHGSELDDRKVNERTLSSTEIARQMGNKDASILSDVRHRVDMYWCKNAARLTERKSVLAGILASGKPAAEIQAAVIEYIDKLPDD